MPFTPNVWTGEKNDQAYSDIRATAIMVNNISAARPQRGISQASILFESKVEGGITRFMAIFEDYTELEGDVGPVRSGRDQFLQWAMPMQALYCHIGRSGITQTYIDSFNYNDLADGSYSRINAHTVEMGINNFVYLAFNSSSEVFADKNTSTYSSNFSSM